MYEAFGPERAKVLSEAYELAKRTFEHEKPLASQQCKLLAEAVEQAAKSGILTADQIASRAILMAVMSPRPKAG